MATDGTGVMLATAVAVVGVLVTGVVASRSSPKSPAAVVVGAGVVVLLPYLGWNTDVDPVWFLPLVVATCGAAVTAYAIGYRVGLLRRMDAALRAPVLRDPVVIESLVPLHERAVALGFTPLPDGVWLAGTYVALLSHADGTIAELLGHPADQPSYAFRTALTDGSHVSSVPWSHGVDPERIRVPGASFEELLERHRDAVAERCRAATTVLVLEPEDVLATSMELGREESDRVMRRVWWYTARMWWQVLTRPVFVPRWGD